MACQKPSDCAPCSKCPEAAEPVLPRCDVVLNDGTYTNATVVVEDGCIIAVTAGEPLLYQPDNNCAGSGTGGSGGQALQGDPGTPGAAGTIQINSVFSLPAGSTPTVDNIGTPNAAILNIGIPRGADGTPAVLPPGASSTAAGIIFEGGLLKNPLPALWPPVLNVVPLAVEGAGVLLGATKRPDGVVELQLDVTGLITWFEGELATLSSQHAAQQLQIDDLLTRVAALEAP